ncbi:MFS transporter [Longispora albida]|uniref:MFS transporter n=1 Tax=Longispora albida TaxID=203523 RepID=UPI000363CAEE|nr:MFS transporter [Longispora albida]
MSRRGFRRLLGVRLSSQVSDGIFQAAIGGAVLFNPQQAASPLEMATGFAILLLPYSFIGPFVGVFLDRWSRRNIMVVANLTRALLIIPIAGLVWAGDTKSAAAGLLAFGVIAINRFFLACLSASLPHVVEDERLATANAVANTLGTVAYTSGLATAVALIGVVGAKDHGYGVIALTALIGYGTSSLLARLYYTKPELGPDDAERPSSTVAAAAADTVRGMVRGAKHLFARRPAFYALLAQGGARGIYGLLTIAMLLFAKTLSHDKQFLAGVFISGMIGALVAAAITPAASRKIGGARWLAALLAANAVIVPILAWGFQEAPLLMAVFLLNVGSMGAKIVVDTALQHECADEYRGRVFSVNDTAFNVLYVGGLFVGAYTLPVSGKSTGMVLAVAAGYALLACWYTLVSRKTTVRV